MLVLLYGREGWFAPVIRASGFNVVFAFPGAHAAQTVGCHTGACLHASKDLSPGTVAKARVLHDTRWGCCMTCVYHDAPTTCFLM